MVDVLRILLLLAVAIVGTAAKDDEDNIPRLEDEMRPRGRTHQRCRRRYEQPCMRCAYAEDGSPIPEYYCSTNRHACPIQVCCNIKTEETCYDQATGHATSCARHDEGGCPCPAGQERCGASEFSSGYCTALCCDWRWQETCYDDSWNPISCQNYADGPCPAPTPSPPPSFDSSATPPPSFDTLGLGSSQMVQRVNYSEDDKDEIFE